MELSVTVTGLETLDEDLKAFQAELAGKVTASMDGVGERMKDALAAHIETDVYGAYSPRQYKRRSEDGSRGKPLSDMTANAKVYNKGAGLSLHYKPTGDHEIRKWSGVDGDDLIGRIEKKDPMYHFYPTEGEIPDRPFWQNFVSEMIEGGALDDYFAAEMLLQGIVVEREDGGVLREPGDGEY